MSQAGAESPPAFEQKLIPAASYLMFRITLNGAPVHPQVKAAMACIRGTLILAVGVKIRDTPDFDFYDDQSAPDRPGAVIDFHLPIET